MANPRPANIPNDVWVCCQCEATNLIANADKKCPLCQHDRCSTCSGPGEPNNGPTGLFPGHPEYQSPGEYQLPGEYNDMWTCGECGAENCDWCSECPVCGASRNTQYSFVPGHFNQCGAGSPAPGMWICPNPNCQQPNSGTYDEQCRTCGTAKP